MLTTMWLKSLWILLLLILVFEEAFNGLPEKLKDIQGHTVNMKLIIISWQKPTNHSDLVSNFTVYYRETFKNTYQFKELKGVNCSDNNYYQHCRIAMQMKLYSPNNFTFKITETNPFGSHSTIYYFNKLQQLYVTVPTNIMVTSADAHSINILFTECEPETIYEVSHYEENKLMNTLNKRCEPVKNRQILHLRGLKSYYNYTIKIRRGMYGVWSNHAMIHHRTLPDIPGSAPLVTNGHYYIDRNLHKISIYWKDINKDNKNGPNFTYFIESSLNNSYETNGTSFTMEWLPDMEITITPKNSVGLSNNISRIVIPGSVSEKLPHIGVFLKDNQSQVFWNTDPMAINYTVFWQSEDGLQLAVVTNNSFIINSSNSESIFILANKKNFSSGMIKQNCFRKNELFELQKLIQHSSEQKSITINWNSSCDQVFFESLTITCEKCNQAKHILDKEINVTFSKLKPDTNYSVDISFKPRFNAAKETYNFHTYIKTKALTDRVSSSGSSWKFITGIAFFSCFVIVFSVAFVLFRLKKKCIKLGVTLPDKIENMKKETELDSISKNDSQSTSSKSENCSNLNKFYCKVTSLVNSNNETPLQQNGSSLISDDNRTDLTEVKNVKCNFNDISFLPYNQVCDSGNAFDQSIQGYIIAP